MNGIWLVVKISHLTTLLVEVRWSERVHTDLYVRGDVGRGVEKKNVLAAVTRMWRLKRATVEQGETSGPDNTPPPEVETEDRSNQLWCAPPWQTPNT